jgi:hypothetical protein
MVWDRSSENVTILKGKASVPLRRYLSGATPLAAATAASEHCLLNMAATLGRVKDGLLEVRSTGGDAALIRAGAHPGARIQSVLRNAARVGSPRPQPPSCGSATIMWLLPEHSPGRSRPLSRPERHGCHSTSQSTPTTEVTPRAHIARLGLVTKRCLEVPPERIEGGSLWPGRALERQSA